MNLLDRAGALWGGRREAPAAATRRAPAGPPELVFTPEAAWKLRFLRDCGPTEVGGFGITAPVVPGESGQLRLVVEDIRLPRQRCSWAHVEWDGPAMAELLDELLDGPGGLTHARVKRVWIHTHPGNSPEPSGVDEATFREHYARPDVPWAVMMILARGGATYARLHLAAADGHVVPVPMRVDLPETPGFPGAGRVAAWGEEYARTVEAAASSWGWGGSLVPVVPGAGGWAEEEEEAELDPLEAVDPALADWREDWERYLAEDDGDDRPGGRRHGR